MRVTQRAIALTSLRGLNGNLAAVNKLQQQLTSGKTVSRPSDSPTGTNSSMITRQDTAGNAQQARNISDGKTVLNSTDSALQAMLTQAQRVRDLTVQALNSGAMSDSALQSIATEVGGLRESLLGQANQVVQGRPLFGGATAGNRAYDDTGTYVGIGGTKAAGGVPAVAVVPVMRQVSDVESVRVDITGPEAFGDPASGKDLFSVVTNIAAHAYGPAADPTALASDLGDLDTAINQMLTATASIGTRAARLDTAAQVNSRAALDLQNRLSETEDVDLPKTIMELNMQQTGYQAALKATAQAIQPTLLDFLR
jgi:flagellar hook-associated protein 3 FlgL